jgi:hypothetical protein
LAQRRRSGVINLHLLQIEKPITQPLLFDLLTPKPWKLFSRFWVR